MKWYEVIFKYLSQSSTYKGLFGLLAAFGVVVKPELSDAIIACAIGVIGLIDVIIDETVEKDTNKAES